MIGMQSTRISPKAIERLGYYVYLYINPFDNSIFYVGKGRGNRVFAHLNDQNDSRKSRVIKKIRAQGKDPRIEILIHGLRDEITALRIEAAVIDLLGLDTLTNKVRGWESRIVGRMEINQLVALYDSEPANIEESAILIRINQLYRYGMDDEELYEATRGVWKLGDRRNNAKYAFAVYKGMVREVYSIQRWFPAGTTIYRTREDLYYPERWEFEGGIAEKTIRRKYIDKSVEAYLAFNSRNPITYVNC